MSNITAVEWLVEQLKERGYAGEFPPYLLFEQAKAMEKNQIVNAYKFGVGDAYDYTSEEGELFYNEIYGK